ncbi:5-formyltetrahydrofolate cyclo-ligase [Myxococcota bacterium]|nr:5-formyltetrahydrofolate cyclo-ligase [Myxococcota bacterium]
MDAAVQAAKRARRTELRARRRALTIADRAAAARTVCVRLRALPALDAARIVALYAAIDDELDVGALGDAVQARGGVAVFPRIDGDALTFAPGPRLVPTGRLRIPEPPSDVAAVPLAEIDVFVVPALGLTPTGARIGYGRGFYDRALRAARSARAGAGVGAPLVVGVTFSGQVVPTLPTDADDEAVDVVVTDEHLFFASPEASRMV